MPEITIEKRGRRYYFLGNTYPVKDQLRDAGAKWDRDARSWYTGKAEVAERFNGASSASTDSSPGSRPRSEAPGLDATVSGRATYRGKTYYVAGRVVHGRTRWDDSLVPIESRDGSRVLLYFRDGSSSFWAMSSELEILKSYRKPTTIARLQEYAQQAKESGPVPAGYYMRNGEILASGCSECRDLGHMCLSCQRDYE
jgi:hypothetical protein